MRRILPTLLVTLVCAAAPAGAQPQPAPDSLLTIALCGDIMMGTTYPSIRLPQNDGADIFADVK